MATCTFHSRYSFQSQLLCKNRLPLRLFPEHLICSNLKLAVIFRGYRHKPCLLHWKPMWHLVQNQFHLRNFIAWTVALWNWLPIGYFPDHLTCSNLRLTVISTHIRINRAFYAENRVSPFTDNVSLQKLLYMKRYFVKTTSNRIFTRSRNLFKSRFSRYLLYISA